jgi:membrane peptidoglycan carboxypeptidase
MRRTALLRGLGIFVGVVLVLGFAADAYAQSFFDSLPSIQGLDSAAFAGDTVIYDSTGKVILADVGNHGDHRLAVRLKDVSPVVVQATVAIEDKGFYTNPGFDLAGIIRAAFDNLRAGHVVGGGSTITQQLAKQQFLTPDQTYSRKIKELALAYELSQTYSKDQIMELYLNKSFYGEQSYGIEAAAETYFHVPASKLDLAQAAMLAGLPQAPTEWNPVLHPDQAQVRQAEVLRAMVRSNFITQDDMDKAMAEKLTYYAAENTSPRNMGSSMKPYTYGSVINARAATVDTPVYDGPSPLIYKDAYSTTKIFNYDGKSHGVLALKKAMGNSLNIAAVKVELSIGVPAVLTWMRNLGVDPRYVNPDGSYNANAPADEYGPSLTLGGYPITLLEHVEGIATYADMGVYHSPQAVLSVTDSRGNELYKDHPEQRARLAIDPAVAYIMAQIMADDQNRCMIFGCNSPLHWSNRIVAAKTGTTDNFKDAATIAFTPDLAVGLWVGDILDYKHFMIPGSDGVFVASPGVHTFVDQALKGVPGNRWYTTPPGVSAGPQNSWYLSDTTKIDKLPGDNPPTPTPKGPSYVVPPDPGSGPVVASPSPCPTPSIVPPCGP